MQCLCEVQYLNFLNLNFPTFLIATFFYRFMYFRKAIILTLPEAHPALLPYSIGKNPCHVDCLESRGGSESSELNPVRSDV